MRGVLATEESHGRTRLYKEGDTRLTDAVINALDVARQSIGMPDGDNISLRISVVDIVRFSTRYELVLDAEKHPDWHNDPAHNHADDEQNEVHYAEAAMD